MNTLTINNYIDKPTCIGGMTNEEIDIELAKGIDSLQNEKAYTPEEVDEILAKELNI